MKHALDIAIVGAGTAGLAAAILLHRQGHRIRLVERFAQARPLGSGIILQPTGLAVLEALGLCRTLLGLGSRIDRLYGADCHSGRTVLDVRYGALPGGRFGLGVHRAALFRILFDAAGAESLDMETGCEAAELETGERVRLRDTAGRAIGTFDLVVDASGARSGLRRFLTGAGEPIALPYGALWASLDRRPGFDDNALTQRYRRASIMIGVLPIGRVEADGPDKTAFFWSLKLSQLAALQAAGLSCWKSEVAALWPQAQPYLDQIGAFDELTLASYGHHTLMRPASRGFAIIGDAAHSTSPQLGQGANMALLDAWALARALETAADVEDALDLYCRMRRWHVRGFQALSRMFTPFYQSDSTALPFIRDRVVASLARVPPVPRLLAAMVAGTIIAPWRPLDLREPDWTSLREAIQ